MKISKAARKTAKELFKASFTDGRLDPAKVKRIATQLGSSKPRYYVDILKDYHRLARLESEKHHAIIESATPLESRMTEQLQRDLRTKYGNDLTTEFRITPELIGGMRIKLGSDVWDSTVRGRLDRLSVQLAHA